MADGSTPQPPDESTIDEGVLEILDLCIHLRPEWRKPAHLVPWIRFLVLSLYGGVRAMCSIPIQHHKTSTTLIGLLWLLKRKPTLQIIFFTYSLERAQAVGKDLREMAVADGQKAKPGFNRIDEWRNEDGGGVVIMSAEQSRLGYPCDILVVDDPIDEESANDPDKRQKIDDKIAHYTARAKTHGGSVLMVASRWSIDDPIGRRENRKEVKWSYFHGAGIKNYNASHPGAPEEEAFAPEIMTVAQHHELRREWCEVDPSGRQWWAQIQNNPLPDSLGLFKSPARYKTLPLGPYRTVFGLDMSYSSSKHADYFALVVLKIYAESWIENGSEVKGERAYIVQIWREKWDPHVVHDTLVLARGMYPGAMTYSYMSGPEKGAATYLAEKGFAIQVMPARYSKRQRAQNTIDKSNAGRILVPEDAPFTPGFVHRTILFTGKDSASNDDEQDALVSAIDGGMMSSVGTPRTLGPRRI